MAELPDLISKAKTEFVPNRIIAEFTKGTFLESIVVLPSGQLYVSSHEEGKIYRVTLIGEYKLHAQVEGKATGLAILPNNALLLSGWDAAGVSVLSKIAPDGAVQTIAHLPDALFLNGITRLSEQIYLIADSYKGAIWQFDVSNNQVSLWLEHPLLGRSHPDAVFPAVNGLKIFGRMLYASNTQQQLLLRIPIENQQPGTPEIFLQGINIDDFASDVAGNLYGTTHVFNSVVKISPSGEVTLIAGAAQGMVGTTALAFEPGQRRAYVTTNGGMSYLPPDQWETGKIVELDLDQVGS
jgi:hypothetical protein